MKRIFEFVLYLFYRYYNKGSHDNTAFSHSLDSTAVLLFMNTFAILFALKINVIDFLPVVRTQGRFIEYITSGLLILPFYILLKKTVKEKTIIIKSYPKKVIQVGNIALILYVILSIIALAVAVKTAHR
jgi:hypothetical protein